jgi:hypothetical protein
MPRRTAPGKERLTVSLSREAARFLRAFRAHAKSPSMSALFEKMVADLQGKVEIEHLDAKLRTYYDTLSASDVKEESAWGAAGEAGLASLEEFEHQPKRQAGRR